MPAANTPTCLTEAPTTRPAFHTSASIRVLPQRHHSCPTRVMGHTHSHAARGQHSCQSCSVCGVRQPGLPCSPCRQSRWAPSLPCGKLEPTRRSRTATSTEQFPREQARCSSHHYGGPAQGRFARRYIWCANCCSCWTCSPSHWKELTGRLTSDPTLLNPLRRTHQAECRRLRLNFFVALTTRGLGQLKPNLHNKSTTSLIPLHCITLQAAIHNNQRIFVVAFLLSASPLPPAGTFTTLCSWSQQRTLPSAGSIGPSCRPKNRTHRWHQSWQRTFLQCCRK